MTREARPVHALVEAGASGRLAASLRAVRRRLAIARVVLGVGLLAHGAAHAVLPLRGAGALEATPLLRGAMTGAWIVSMVGFVAAGLGVLGARPFRRIAGPAALTAALASVVAITVFTHLDLLWAVLVDGAVAILVAGRGLRYVAGRRRHRVLGRVGDVVAWAFFLYVAVAATTHPWHTRWGATERERLDPLPGDVRDRDPAYEVVHAVTIHASPREVWPWLVQIGQDRGGFYSYTSLENAFRLDIHNADVVHPEWQDRRAGDFVRAVPRGWLGGALGDDLGWRITLVEPDRALVLRHWGAFVLVPQADGTTRLVVRSKMKDPNYPVPYAAAWFLGVDFPHFVMERAMLLGIRDRVEQAGRARAAL